MSTNKLDPQRRSLKSANDGYTFYENCSGNHRYGGDSGGNCSVSLETKNEWVTIETDSYEGSAMMNLGTAIAVYRSLGSLLSKAGVIDVKARLIK